MELTDFEVVVASSGTDERDGIGIEVWQNNALLIEIFRDDTKHERTVSIYTPDFSLALLEKSIEIFKDKIPWAFLDDHTS